MHSGKPKKLLFDINKFSKFKDKIIYVVVDKPPPDLVEVKQNDSLYEKQSKMTVNAKEREMYQINQTQDGIVNAGPEDIIIVSDVDEIPNLEKINFIPQFLNWFTRSDTNLLSITKISLFRLTPEYILHNSVPMYPSPPVITIFLDFIVIVLY